MISLHAVPLNSVLPVRFRQRRRADSTIARASFTPGVSDVDIGEFQAETLEDMSLDSGVFEEVFPTLKRSEQKPRSRRSREVLGPTSSLVPDEWLAVQQYHLKSKKERKRETQALQLERARRRLADDRAIQEQAARDGRERLLGLGSPTSVQSNEDAFPEEYHSQKEGDEWQEDLPEVEDSPSNPTAELEPMESSSGRARPKDARSELQFSTLQAFAQSMREEQEMQAKLASLSGDGDAEADRHLPTPAQRSTLTDEEKALLKVRNLNFAKISSESWSPLHTIAASGQVYLAAELLKRGAAVDALDKHGLTALHKAVQSGRKTMVRLLLKAGANPNIRDPNGATLLHYAAQTGSHEIAKLLLRDRADVNAADNDGWTALHVAVQSGRTELIRCLVNRGADIGRPNGDGNTPLDLSLSFGNCFKFYDTIRFLKRKELDTRGSDPNSERGSVAPM